jgi:AmiR/NasT family two-component response regulator
MGGGVKANGSMAWRAGTALAELAQFQIAVATRRDDSGEQLIRELQRTRARVRHVWPLPDRLPDDVDVIFCDLAPGLTARIPWMPGEPKAALVLMAPTAPPPDLDLLRNCAPDAVLHRPFTTHEVLTALVVAHAQFSYHMRLQTRIDKLEETLRAIRSVERAKAILMSTRSMREDEAYQFLRRQAMDRRVPITAVAAAIVDSHEILG